MTQPKPARAGAVSRALAATTVPQSVQRDARNVRNTVMASPGYRVSEGPLVFWHAGRDRTVPTGVALVAYVTDRWGSSERREREYETAMSEMSEALRNAGYDVQSDAADLTSSRQYDLVVTRRDSDGNVLRPDAYADAQQILAARRAQ